MEDWRHWKHLGIVDHILDPRDFCDYKKIVAAAHARERRTILLDLQPTMANLFDGVMQLVRYSSGQGMVIFGGSKRFPFNLWMDDANSTESGRVQTLLHSRYANHRRNYCFVTGNLFVFHTKQRPQMLIESCEQISDFPLRPDEMSQRLREHHRSRDQVIKSSAA